MLSFTFWNALTITCRYSHPYLPGLHTSIHIEDFLWTGEGEGQENGIEEEQAQEGRLGRRLE